MNTIIVLTFFGILGCTFCEKVGTWPVGCRNVHNQAVSDLKFEQFFNGSWYLTYAKHRNHSVLRTKFDMTFEPLEIKYEMGGVKVTCKGTKIEGARHTEYKCEGNWRTIPGGTIPGGEKTPYTDYEAIMSVIDTDYTSYATVYVCKKSEKHEDNVFVLSRTESGEPPEAAKQSLKKLGEKLENFHKFSFINFELIQL